MNTPSAAPTLFIPPMPSLQAERTWQDALYTLIDHCVTHDRCFSSGELARELRLQRPDFRFAVTEVGEHVKDLFHEGAIEYRDAQGRTSAAVQVPRRTTGRSRTPANTEVFVYAATPRQGLAHDFEVDVPHPTFTPTMLERQRFAAAQAQANAEMLASVHADGRLCIPRRALEELSHATGVAMRAGASVWIELLADGSALRVYLDARPGCTAHALQPERGRVRFSSLDPARPFVGGSRYAIVVEGDGLRIELREID